MKQLLRKPLVRVLAAACTVMLVGALVVAPMPALATVTAGTAAPTKDTALKAATLSVAAKKAPRYCLKVNLQQNVLTIYKRDKQGAYSIPVKAYLCSGNSKEDLGVWRLGEKYRFHELFGNCYSQWTSRIHDHILFHTVPYRKYRDPNSLKVKEYNKLGTSASAGCIRLQCVATRWIYKHCVAGTKVVFYKSENPGPLGKPELEKLPKWHTWDPTDPTMKAECKKHGCKHQKV